VSDGEFLANMGRILDAFWMHFGLSCRAKGERIVYGTLEKIVRGGAEPVSVLALIARAARRAGECGWEIPFAGD
jgi:hypothetical protein